MTEKGNPFGSSIEPRKRDKGYGDEGGIETYQQWSTSKFRVELQLEIGVIQNQLGEPKVVVRHRIMN